MAPRTITVGDKHYTVARLTFGLLRELEPAEDKLADLQAEVDGIDARLAAVQAQLIELADDGKADEANTGPLVEQEKALSRERRANGRAQVEARIELLAPRLGTSAAELHEVLDLTDLERVEGEVANPPTSAPGAEN